jgi:hypothetical protein
MVDLVFRPSEPDLINADPFRLGGDGVGVNLPFDVPLRLVDLGYLVDQDASSFSLRLHPLGFQ